MDIRMFSKKDIRGIVKVIRSLPAYDEQGNRLEDWTKFEGLSSLVVNVDPFDVVRAFAAFLEANNPEFSQKQFKEYITGNTQGEIE